MSQPTPEPEPVWAVAELFPRRGQWTEHDYLALATRRRVELVDGTIEVLAMPTERHQTLLTFVLFVLAEYARTVRGKALPSCVRVRTGPGRFREPDLVFMTAANAHRRHDEYWEGADLVVEIVSAGDATRDVVVKRREYADAAIPEYWIVDPTAQTVTVLRLDGGRYVEHRVAGRGAIADSAVFSGLRVDVSALFDAE